LTLFDGIADRLAKLFSTLRHSTTRPPAGLESQPSRRYERAYSVAQPAGNGAENAIGGRFGCRSR
jgi:hypothetical protein